MSLNIRFYKKIIKKVSRSNKSIDYLYKVINLFLREKSSNLCIRVFSMNSIKKYNLMRDIWIKKLSKQFENFEESFKKNSRFYI